jgi:hypothetical protein
MEEKTMKRNYEDVETIINLTGRYVWDGKIVIKKSDIGFDVGGFEFKTIEAACEFIENYPNNSFSGKTARLTAEMARATARGGARLIGLGLRFTGKTLETAGRAIKKGMDRYI